MLLQVSGELRACLRETDVLARLGGDEFAVILPRESLEDAAVDLPRLGPGEPSRN